MSNLIYPSRIKHFSHHHILELTNSNQVGPNFLCAKCKQRNVNPVSTSIPPSSDIYACRACDYFLHFPCIQVPSHLIKHGRPLNNMPHNSGPSASETIAVQQNSPQMPPRLRSKLMDSIVMGVGSGAAMVVGKTLMGGGHGTSDGGSGSSVNGGGDLSDGGGCAVITEGGGGYFESDGDDGDYAVMTEGGGGYLVSDGGGGDYAVNTEGGGSDYDGGGIDAGDVIDYDGGGIDAGGVIEEASSWIKRLIGYLADIV